MPFLNAEVSGQTAAAAQELCCGTGSGQQLLVRGVAEDRRLMTVRLHKRFDPVQSWQLGTHADRLTFVNDLRVITSAVSLGHDETLIAYEEYPEGPAKAFAQPFRDHGLVRLAIGLEAVDDLIADLDASLTTAYGPR